MPDSLRQRLVTGGRWVIAGKVVTASSTLLATLLLGRLLSRDLVGVYGLAFTLATVAAMAGQLGLHLAVVRFVAAALGTGRPGRARGAVALAFRYCTLGNLAVVALLLGGGGALLAAWWRAPQLGELLGLVVLWTVLTSFQVLISETFRGLQDLRAATLLGGVVPSALTVLVLGVAWLARGTLGLAPVLGIAVAATAVSVGAGVVALVPRLRALPRGEAPRTGEIFAVSMPLWVSGLTAFAQGQFDLWVVGARVAQAEVGTYFVALRLVTLVSMSLMLVNLVVPPFVAELYARGERERLERILRQTATIAGVPALLVLGAYVAFGGPILGLVGAEYRAGAAVLALLSVGRLANVLTGSCGVTMGMTGHQNVLMSITLVTSAATVAACFLAVRPWGLIGVAAASSAGAIAQNVALWLATRRATGMWTHVGWVRAAELRQILSRGR